MKSPIKVHINTTIQDEIQRIESSIQSNAIAKEPELLKNVELPPENLIKQLDYLKTFCDIDRDTSISVQDRITTVPTLENSKVPDTCKFDKQGDADGDSFDTKQSLKNDIPKTNSSVAEVNISTTQGFDNRKNSSFQITTRKSTSSISIETSDISSNKIQNGAKSVESKRGTYLQAILRPDKLCSKSDHDNVKKLQYRKSIRMQTKTTKPLIKTRNAHKRDQKRKKIKKPTKYIKESAKAHVHDASTLSLRKTRARKAIGYKRLSIEGIPPPTSNVSFDFNKSQSKPSASLKKISRAEKQKPSKKKSKQSSKLPLFCKDGSQKYSKKETRYIRALRGSISPPSDAEYLGNFEFDCKLYPSINFTPSSLFL